MSLKFIQEGRRNGMNSSSPILKFYENKTVFITGATGFMGKVSTGGLAVVCWDLTTAMSGLGGEAVTKYQCEKGVAVDQT